MRILNLACGATRIQDDGWTNLDRLHPVLLPDTPERKQLDSEVNYCEHDLESGTIPFEDWSMDCVVASHCFEHWECNVGAQIMRECHRVLKPGGMLVVSVPDADVFKHNYPLDKPENAMALFGEPIHLPDGEDTFTGYALWCPGRHRVIFTETVLWHYFKRAFFKEVVRMNYIRDVYCVDNWFGNMDPKVIHEATKALNRPLFSLVMVGRKG